MHQDATHGMVLRPSLFADTGPYDSRPTDDFNVFPFIGEFRGVVQSQ